MVITCPSCKRRFNLPVDKVKSRTVKLKCSRCKSMFTQDLAALADVATAKLSEAEAGAIARLPAQAPPAPPRPARMAPQPRPTPVSTGPITKPLAPVAQQPRAEAPPQPNRALQGAAAMASQPRAEARGSEGPAGPAAASTGPATRPWAPVVPQLRHAPAVVPRPAPPPPPKPVEPVIQGYESYAEAPAVDEEHQEALARAAEAAAAQAAVRAQKEASERAAAEEAEAAASQAAVDAALEQAATEAIENSGPIPEPPPAEEAFGVPTSDSLPPDLVAGLDAVARGRVAAGDAGQTEAVLRTTGPRNEAAADLFRGAQTASGRFALAGAPAGADLDDFVLLSDEETPGAGRWIALGLGILLALFVATSVFVLARNSWKLDTGHLGQQIRHAFWMA
ncbi:MAG: zinc-ribbon domain-containing protein, partial [Deltaproteobacteria bacterium]|nr:zinc-ribbon domain-containing protein [Deltaproteobacteria bacterium]